MTRPRLRDLGITIGTLPTGPFNAITDVPDVWVGHTTVYPRFPTRCTHRRDRRRALGPAAFMKIRSSPASIPSTVAAR